MDVREYVRLCKQAGCGQPFNVSAPSIEQDREIGLSEPEYCPKHRALHARSYSRIACHHYEIKFSPEGEELVREIEQRKKIENRNAKELKGEIFDPWKMPEEGGLGPGGVGRFQRPARSFLPNSEFKPETKVFQIAEKKEELLQALEDYQVIVLVGTTGSGKSTYVPWLLLTGGEPGGLSKWALRGPICVTQPRIQATRQVPRFIANKLNGTSLGIGSQIGFCHSNADDYDRRTRLIFMTDGKLINDIVSGAVGNYSIVIIDEAHERSVNIDLILGLLRDQLYLYPHLRVIIASATIDFNAFLGFFYPALQGKLAPFADEKFLRSYSYLKYGKQVPFIYSEGRRFEIVKHWWGAPDLPDEKGRAVELLPSWWKTLNQGQVPTRDQYPQVIAELVQKLCTRLDELSPTEKQQEDGHILVFLPGTREIDQTVSNINALKLKNVKALPLYAQRPLDEQESALNPDPEKHPDVYGKRRVVVSTNVAETSLTVEGAKFVIDTGYIKESFWNPLTQVLELQTVRHSQSGCKQRWGRAGRVSSGHAYMLYTQKQYETSFPKDSSPSIPRASLEQVLLTAKTAGVRTQRTRDGVEGLDFKWMPLSDTEDANRFREELAHACRALKAQSAIDSDGDLSRYGLELRGMPAEMDVVRIFTEGEKYGMGVEVATLLPFLKLEYGLQGLLQWKRDWSTYDKLAIRQHHLDLVFGCRDDLELYLKLWILWEMRTESERQEWEKDGGIDYKTFQDTIEAERRKVLDTAMDWRKAEKRGVALRKIDALRALIAYCLYGEIYVPLKAHGGDAPARRAESIGEETYWADIEEYAEYDDSVNFDSSYSGGLYRRLIPQPNEPPEASLVEIAPTSICTGRSDADLVVACQRRANFRQPARAKVLGMNMIRLEQAWMSRINGSVVQRALLYASLSGSQEDNSAERLGLRLFLPWLLPRGKAKGIVESWDPTTGAKVRIQLISSSKWPVTYLGDKPLEVQGELSADHVRQDRTRPIAVDQEIAVNVVGYKQDSAGDPVALLSQLPQEDRAFDTFTKQNNPGKGATTIQVVMHKVLEDPLGRNPMFLVRETETGLEIPMSDSDFCGNTHPQSYFGRRFEVGSILEVDVLAIDKNAREVTLSRGRQLLEEYGRLPAQDQRVYEVPVHHVDEAGLYLSIPSTSYLGFVRRALWPVGLDPHPGQVLKARLRRADRHVNVSQRLEQFEKGEGLPEELDLGIDLNLRVPVAYDRYKQIKKRAVGDVVTGTIEKAMDNGGLLVELDQDLKAVIFESELGLAEDGRLKTAREYTPGKTTSMRLTQMIDDSATIRGSIFRLAELPEQVNREDVLEVLVLVVREDSRTEGQLRVICSWQNRYQVQATALVDKLDGPLDPGDLFNVRVSRVDRKVSLIQGNFEGRAKATDGTR